MKSVLTSLFVASTLVYAANVAAANVCPTMDEMHQNAFMLDTVHHAGSASPKGLPEGMLAEGNVYSSQQFKSQKKKWYLVSNIDYSDETITDDYKLQEAQNFANSVSYITTQVHSKSSGKYEIHMCAYSSPDFLVSQVAAISIEGKLPKAIHSAVNEIASKK